MGDSIQKLAQFFIEKSMEVFFTPAPGRKRVHYEFVFYLCAEFMRLTP